MSRKTEFKPTSTHIPSPLSIAATSLLFFNQPIHQCRDAYDFTPRQDEAVQHSGEVPRTAAYI